MSCIVYTVYGLFTNSSIKIPCSLTWIDTCRSKIEEKLDNCSNFDISMAELVMVRCIHVGPKL